jgi:hypothetical protein
MMLNSNDLQLDLPVDTLQPGECFVVQLTTRVSWDETRTEYAPRGVSIGWYPAPVDENEMVGTLVSYRASDESTKLIGVVTDDTTLAILRKRAPEYEKRASADMVGANAHLCNFKADSTYTFTKEKHIVLTCNC